MPTRHKLEVFVHPVSSTEHVGVHVGVRWWGSGRRRRWSRGRNNYLVGVLGMVGAFMLIGGLGFLTVWGVAGALGVIASSVAVWRSDLAAKTSPRSEVVWLVVAVALLVGGILLYGAG